MFRGLLLRVLAGVARLVPAHHRERWLREWRAEFLHAFSSRPPTSWIAVVAALVPAARAIRIDPR